MIRITLAVLPLCLCVLAGCFQWTEDSQGKLQSVGLPGVPLWQSSPPPPSLPTQLGFTQDEAARMSGPVMVIPSASGSYRYRFYQAGQNHCAEDLQKMLAERATSYATGPAPYCTDNPTSPPIKKSGDFLVF